MWQDGSEQQKSLSSQQKYSRSHLLLCWAENEHCYPQNQQQ
jgi:hypothetical protein